MIKNSMLCGVAPNPSARYFLAPQKTGLGIALERLVGVEQTGMDSISKHWFAIIGAMPNL